MSWDIFVQDLPPDLTSVSDIPDDYTPGDLGERQSIIDAICRVIPNADFSDPAWRIIESPTFSIEVNLGTRDPVQGFAFHVRDGDHAAYVIHDILSELNLRALDGSSPSGFFELKCGSLDGLRKWRRYRDQILQGKT